MAKRVVQVSAVTGADLAREPFLKDMRTADLRRLATAARFTDIPAGRRIFSQSDPAERFWLVRDGTVIVDLHMPGRGSVIIDTFGPGSVLGWSWLFRPYRWHFGGVATTPVRAVEFDGRLVRTLCAVDPAMGYELTRRFAELIVERLETSQSRLTELSEALAECDVPSPFAPGIDGEAAFPSRRRLR
ncbi:Crp/Fnr family transcriptional regulator [Actinomadura monticuli]|uniref:Cyclic nucleotide-binding domain-containing protein n=1 Tax=Actinomadura monticuli TaxID=3097367 RepID=A0ABV4QI74_9ACTN